MALPGEGVGRDGMPCATSPAPGEHVVAAGRTTTARTALLSAAGGPGPAGFLLPPQNPIPFFSEIFWIYDRAARPRRLPVRLTGDLRFRIPGRSCHRDQGLLLRGLTGFPEPAMRA